MRSAQDGERGCDEGADADIELGAGRAAGKTARAGSLLPPTPTPPKPKAGQKPSTMSVSRSLIIPRPSARWPPPEWGGPPGPAAETAVTRPMTVLHESERELAASR